MSSTSSRLTRLPDWEERWQHFVQKHYDAPLIWGVDDCMLMAGRNVRALTGEDVFSEHVGQYDSEIGAFRYLASLGWRMPEEMVATFLPSIPVAFAQRGDLLLYKDCIGVCLGKKTMFKAFGGEQGSAPEFINTLLCDKAWRVG